MKAKRKAGRRGRKRSAGLREPNGRACRSAREPQGPVILDEVLAQRARAMGVECMTVDAKLREAMRDGWAGFPLGRLRLLGEITDRQFRAGSSYAILRRRWDRLAEVPSRHAKVARLPIADVIPADLAPQVIDMLALEQESDIDGAWLRAKLHLRKLQRLIGPGEALAVLEAVCVEEASPAVRDWLPLLRLGLDRAAEHFHLPPEGDGPRKSEEVRSSEFVNG